MKPKKWGENTITTTTRLPASMVERMNKISTQLGASRAEIVVTLLKLVSDEALIKKIVEERRKRREKV